MDELDGVFTSGSAAIAWFPRGFWKLPETYERGREAKNALAIVVTVTKIVVLAGLIVFGMWLLIQATRHGAQCRGGQSSG